MSDRVEKEIKAFAYNLMEKLGWKAVPINRVKVSKMRRYKGLCISDDCESVYLVFSETTHDDNKDFFATVIHELIHAHLLVNKKKFSSHHKHGGKFKKIAKQIAKLSNGFYTWQEIVK